MGRNFRELLETKWAEGKFVCVGLDSDFEEIPDCIRRGSNAGASMIAFNEKIVEATKDLVLAYKPNTAFYEAQGRDGIDALKRTIAFIRDAAPEVPVILDAKRADIGNTNKGYAAFAFDELDADAITVHPYLGGEALKPFFDRKDKGIIVLCRTSNPGAGEFQDLPVPRVPNGPRDREAASDMIPLHEHVAFRVTTQWNGNNNCGVVVGATFPEEMQRVRRIVGDMPILIPGIGTQGGNLEKTVRFGKDVRGKGMIINSSRGVLFASKGNDFAEAARVETRKLQLFITEHLNKIYVSPSV